MLQRDGEEFNISLNNSGVTRRNICSTYPQDRNGTHLNATSEPMILSSSKTTTSREIIGNLVLLLEN